MQIPDAKFHSVGMDFITQLPETSIGHDAILVIIDRLTKLVCLVPFKTTIRAEGTAELFMNHWVRHYGWPKEIVSDRDPRFTSQFLALTKLCQRRSILKRMGRLSEPME